MAGSVEESEEIPMEHIRFGSGRHRISLVVETTGGNGVIMAITGGEQPHVGGIAIASPHPRLHEEGLTIDVSQICLPGHKDVIVAVEIAKEVASQINEPVSVTAGIHVDDATMDDISLLRENALGAVRAWLSRI